MNLSVVFILEEINNMFSKNFVNAPGCIISKDKYIYMFKSVITNSSLLSIDSIGTKLGIIGAIFVAFGEPLTANIIWLVSNPLLLYHNHKIGQSSQSRMFFVFTAISLFGVVNLW